LSWLGSVYLTVRWIASSRRLDPRLVTVNDTERLTRLAGHRLHIGDRFIRHFQLNAGV
jgi:hypothetical protein